MLRHKLTLPLIIAAVVAAGAMAPTASAQVEVTKEDGTHCSSVIAAPDYAFGGCHSTASGHLLLEAFGSLVSACYTRVHWRVDEDGHGYIYSQLLDGDDCTTPPCPSGVTSAPATWETELAEWGGRLTAEVQYCVQSSALGAVSCHLPYLDVDTFTHQPEILALADPCESGLGFVHLTGGLLTFSSGLEINH